MKTLSLHISGRNNFIWLLGGLIFFLFAGAVADQFQLEHTNRIINLALMITLVLNIWCVDNPRTNFIGWKAGATFIIAITMITDTVIASNVLAMYQLFMTFLFLALTTWQAWSQVMFTGRVDQNKIVGAVCIYLLIGLLWAFAYLIVEAFLPGSFKGLEGELWQKNTDNLVYYSIVTLTTLGYGDITPEGPIAQFLAYMEAVIGVFYMAVLVASLIGIRLAGVDPGKPIKELEQEARAARDAAE
jgi:hypothetical protein